MLSTRVTKFLGLLQAGLLLVVISPVASYGAFVIKLPQAQKYCFFETLKKGDRFDMSFVTTSEGEQAIKFWMNDPSGHRLHGVERESSSSFGFNPEAQGNYEFCFDNGVTHGDKEITFTVYGPEEHSGFGKDFEKHDEAHRTIDDEIQALSSSIQHMRDSMVYLVRREARHSSTAGSTYSRIFWWGVMQMGILVGTCAFQIYYLKRFFEVKRIV